MLPTQRPFCSISTLVRALEWFCHGMASISSGLIARRKHSASLQTNRAWIRSIVFLSIVAAAVFAASLSVSYTVNALRRNASMLVEQGSWLHGRNQPVRKPKYTRHIEALHTESKPTLEHPDEDTGRLIQPRSEPLSDPSAVIAGQPPALPPKDNNSGDLSIDTVPESESSSDIAPAPMLVIGIPTIFREGREAYLTQTLSYIAEQFSSNNGNLETLQTRDTLSDVSGEYPLRLRVFVMCNTRPPETHPSFLQTMAGICKANAIEQEKLRNSVSTNIDSVRTFTAAHAKYGECSMSISGDAGVFFHPHHPFAFALNLIAAPTALRGDDSHPNVPGPRVQRQTLDVVSLMRATYQQYGTVAQYYMFQEDDFRICEQAGEVLAYVLHKAHATLPDWNAIRISYGLNGAILRMQDVPVLSAYYSQHFARRPPDHLTVEWFAGETQQSAADKRGRPHVAFRYNMLEHFGQTSSLREVQAPLYALCYDELNVDVVFEVESFRPECRTTDLWPCPPEVQHFPAPNIDFEALQKDAKANSVQTWGTRP